MKGRRDINGSKKTHIHCRAEKNDAYIGEINMLQASSFSGQSGAVWGYDLAVNPEIKNKTVKPVFEVPYKSTFIPVYPVLQGRSYS